MVIRHGVKWQRKKNWVKIAIGAGIWLLITIPVVLISQVLFNWDDYYALVIAAATGIVEYFLFKIPFVEKSLDALVDSWLDHGRVTRLTKQQQQDIKEYLTGGVEPGEKINMQLYLEEYLDKPFAGRENLLKTLTRWQQGEQPYYLLTEQAGKGKTALVIKWISQLRLTDPSLEIALIPVSNRFETNQPAVFLRLMAQRLAFLHNDRLTGGYGLEDTIRYWQNVCHDYLKENLPGKKRLLVIIDGLDESSDQHNLASLWKAILPLSSGEYPANTRLLLAIRRWKDDESSEAWRQRLAIPSTIVTTGDSFPELTRKEIIDMLESLGYPLDEIPRRSQVLDELLRLCENDPLLVRHYAEQLQQQGNAVKVEDLQRLSSGYPGIFEYWRQQYRDLFKDPAWEERITAFFEVLALAKSPLTCTDCVQLLQDDHPGLRSQEMIDTIAETCQRFIIGNGRQQPFTFQHPRFKDYYRDEVMGQDRCRAVNALFLRYGQRSLAQLTQGGLVPEQTSDYLVRHYGEHLDDAGSPPADYYALLCEGWQRAHRHHSQTESSFLDDVLRVIGVARQDGSLGMVIFGCLCVSSVASLSSNIDGELLALLLKHGVLDLRQATALADRQRDPDQRVSAYLAIAQESPTYEKPLLEKALDAARQIKYDYRRSCALSAIAPQLSDPVLQAQVISEALDTARQIEDDSLRSLALSAIAPQLSDPALQAQVLSEALTAARQIKDDDDRSEALTSIAPYLSNPGLQAQVLGEALDAVRQIKDDYARSLALSAIAPLLSDPALQAQVLSEALDAVRQVKDGIRLSRALSAIAPLLSDPALQEQHLETARQIKDDDECVRALAAIAPYLSDPALQMQVLSEALETARQIEDVYFRSQALTAITPHLSDPTLQIKVLSEALTAARQIKDDYAHSCALSALAPHLSTPVLQHQYQKVACQIKDDDSISKALSAIAPHLSDPALQHQYLEVACQIKDDDPISKALSAIAPQLSDPTLQQQYLDSARQIKDDYSISKALSAIAPQLSDPALQQQVLSEALDTARQIKDDYDRSEALAAIVPQLSDPALQQQVLSEALDSARQIKDDYPRSRALSAIAPHLSDPAPLKHFIETANQIEYEYIRSESLTTIAAQLSDLSLQEQALTQALTAACHIKPGMLHSHVLTAIAPLLSDPALQAQYHADARQIEDDIFGSRATALAAIVPQLSDPALQAQVLTEALETAHQIKHDYYRSEALAIIVPNLDQTLLRQIAQTYFDAPLVNEHWFTSQIYAALAKCWVECQLPATALTDLFENNLMEQRSIVFDLIGAMSPAIVSCPDGEKQLSIILHAMQEVSRWWP